MDRVSELYSKPLITAECGYRQLGGGPFENWRRYAIPLWTAIKSRLGVVGKEVAESVKDAGSTTLRKIASEIPAVAAEGVKQVLERGAAKLVKKVIPKKRPAPPPPELVKSKRHKRSRIDDLLGDDSY